MNDPQQTDNVPVADLYDVVAYGRDLKTEMLVEALRAKQDNIQGLIDKLVQDRADLNREVTELREELATVQRFISAATPRKRASRKRTDAKP